MAKWVIKYQTKKRGWKFLKELWTRTNNPQVFSSCKKAVATLRERVQNGYLMNSNADENGFVRSIAQRIDV